jgi:hypothetical protein
MKVQLLYGEDTFQFMQQFNLNKISLNQEYCASLYFLEVKADRRAELMCGPNSACECNPICSLHHRIDI